MKDAVKGIASKFADALELRERWHHQQVFQGAKAISEAIRTLSVLRKDVEDARELVKGVHMVEGIGPTTALSEASKCLGLKWNLKGCHLDLTTGRLQDVQGGKGSEKGKAMEVEDDNKGKEEKEKANEEKADAEKKSPSELQEVDKEKADEEKKPEVGGEEINELDNLTDEERRKRRKILRLKEKLAAASAAAEKKDTHKNKDKGDLKQKEKRSTKEKETETKEKENSEAIPTAANSPRSDAPGKEGHSDTKQEREGEADGDVPTRAAEECEDECNKLHFEPSFPPRIEPLPKSKSDAVSALRKPRGSRHSLKKSKTVTFMCPSDDATSEEATLDDTSEDIKGLDLEASRLTHDDKENRERETETGSDRESEELQTKRRMDSEKNKTAEVFEMEPEEKERIATELLQVGKWRR